MKRTNKKATYWTEENINKLKSLVGRVFPKEMTKTIGISYPNILKKIKELNLDSDDIQSMEISESLVPMVKELADKNKSLRYISRVLNRHQRIVKEFLNTHQILFSGCIRIDKKKMEEIRAIFLKNPEFSSRKISEIMKTPAEATRFFLIKNLLILNNKAKRERLSEMQLAGIRYCYHCDKTLSIEEFDFSKKDRRYKTYCKHCRRLKCQLNLQSMSRNADLDRFVQYKFRAARQRAKERKIEFSLTERLILDIFNHQSGLCFYTGIPMDIKTRSLNSMSIDRIDSSKGYSEDNIVLCISSVNNFKKDLLPFYFLDICSRIGASSAATKLKLEQIKSRNLKESSG